MFGKVILLSVAALASSVLAQSAQASAGYTCAPYDEYVVPGNDHGSPLCSNAPPSTDPNTGADVTPGPNELWCQYSTDGSTADCPVDAYHGGTCWYNKTTGQVDPSKSDDVLDPNQGNGADYCPPAIPPSSKRLRARHQAHAARAEPAMVHARPFSS